MAENIQPAAVIARLLMVSERHVRRLADDGIIPKAGAGRYPLVGAVQGYIRHLRDRALKGDLPATETTARSGRGW